PVGQVGDEQVVAGVEGRHTWLVQPAWLGPVDTPDALRDRPVAVVASAQQGREHGGNPPIASQNAWSSPSHAFASRLAPSSTMSPTGSFLVNCTGGEASDASPRQFVAAPTERGRRGEVGCGMLNYVAVCKPEDVLEGRGLSVFVAGI